jgi:2'-5' RNA ligase
MSDPAGARLFIGLDLPIELRQELSSWARCALRAAAASPPALSPRDQRRGRRVSRRAVGRAHGIRAIDAESMHVTLSFLGSRPIEQIEPLCGLIESLEQPPMGEVSLGAPLWLPTRHPRAVAIELHDDSRGLAQLHQRVDSDLRAAGLAGGAPTHGSGHRAFRPHVTVARLRQGAVPCERTLEPTPRRAFSPQRVVLYRSWLSPQGASYEALAWSMIAPDAQAA